MLQASILRKYKHKQKQEFPTCFCFIFFQAFYLFVYHQFVRISWRINSTYDIAKQTKVRAIKPVSCGQINNKLCPKGNGPAIAPLVSSLLTWPRPLTVGATTVVVD